MPASDSVALELPLSEAQLPTHSAPPPVHRHVAPRPRVVVPATHSRRTRAHVRRTRVPVTALPGGSPGAAGPAAGVTDRERMALVGRKIAVGEQTVCNRPIAQWHWQRALFEQHGGTAVQRAAAAHGALRQRGARRGSARPLCLRSAMGEAWKATIRRHLCTMRHVTGGPCERSVE